MATKTLKKIKTDKYDAIARDSSLFAEKGKLTKEEKIEYKSYNIKKNLKLKKYVRN